MVEGKNKAVRFSLIAIFVLAILGGYAPRPSIPAAVVQIFSFLQADPSWRIERQGVSGAHRVLAAPADPPVAPDVQPAFPIRAAFYYPWFPQAWTQRGFTPYTNYTPSLGFYSNDDASTLASHIAAMQYGNIQAGIASWWGMATPTDIVFPRLLRAAGETGFRWAIYYEAEGYGNSTVRQISSDLTYLLDLYGKNPAYLRVNGRPVIFVYADPWDRCGMADRWKQANTKNWYLMLKVFPGYERCSSQPDSWHQYAPAKAVDIQGTYSYTISPGFWLKGSGVRLKRDPQAWMELVRYMASSDTDWHLITTFNEWGEGTSVEPAAEWASTSGYGWYLDALHTNGLGTPEDLATSIQAPSPVTQK